MDNDWWERLMDCYKSEGGKDAEFGVFEPPNPGSDDPQDDAENAAYKRGFDERRKELGDKFEWA